MATQKKKKRGRVALPEAERKGRLIQARVADDLDATLREEARRRRVSVSQLIRNVLEDTFNLVDHVVSDASELARQVRRDARRIADSAHGRERAAPAQEVPAEAWKTVDAWQEVVLNRTVRCARCRRSLAKGTPAACGISADPGAPRLFVCPTCVR